MFKKQSNQNSRTKNMIDKMNFMVFNGGSSSNGNVDPATLFDLRLGDDDGEDESKF